MDDMSRTTSGVGPQYQTSSV